MEQKGKYTVEIEVRTIKNFKEVCKLLGMKQNFVVDKLMREWTAIEKTRMFVDTMKSVK